MMLEDEKVGKTNYMVKCEIATRGDFFNITVIWNNLKLKSFQLWNCIEKANQNKYKFILYTPSTVQHSKSFVPRIVSSRRPKPPEESPIRRHSRSKRRLVLTLAFLRESIPDEKKIIPF